MYKKIQQCMLALFFIGIYFPQLHAATTAQRFGCVPCAAIKNQNERKRCYGFRKFMLEIIKMDRTEKVNEAKYARVGAAVGLIGGAIWYAYLRRDDDASFAVNLMKFWEGLQGRNPKTSDKREDGVFWLNHRISNCLGPNATVDAKLTKVYPLAYPFLRTYVDPLVASSIGSLVGGLMGLEIAGSMNAPVGSLALSDKRIEELIAYYGACMEDPNYYYIREQELNNMNLPKEVIANRLEQMDENEMVSFDGVSSQFD